MRTFDHIAVIFNPKSTGDAPKMAKDLSESITGYREVIGRKAVLYPTKHAGHARELTREISLKHSRPLIISVSGDGGYNEVINGVMDAKSESRKARPVVTVMAAGNANDHKRVMRGDTPLLRLIKRGEVKEMDIISISAKASGYKMKRYAHSYIGLGLTPEVGYELNKNGKSPMDELWLTLKTLHQFTPFTVERDGKTRRYDNIVFANINEMAKFIKLDTRNTIHDDKFEVIALRHRGKFRTILSLIGATLFGFRQRPSYSTFSFTLPDAQPLQCDGEIEKLPAGCVVAITSHHHAIETLF